ncbi:MAG: RagB/SusD family nutrient uptake outer membrane protein [Bacteroidales bacterium]|nr:RagB/SusD family nutrient uptake outer membrane protein [Bacteroidales bacterium]
MNFFNIRSICAFFSACIILNACTDLEEQVIDEIMSQDIHTLEGAGISLLAAAYDKGEKVFAEYGTTWALQQLTTDETVLPVRGEDWRDGGMWKALHEFTWNAANTKIEDNWVSLNSAIAQAASAIDLLKDSDIANKEMYLAEACGLWALYTYNLIDLFDKVPYRNPFNLSFVDAPVIKQGNEAIQLCIDMLLDAIPNLASKGENGTHTGRFTKEAAYALLAKIYLNKAVYDDRFKEASNFNFIAGGYMDKVIEYTDKIIQSGKFELQGDYFEIFGVNNDQSPEIIFAISQLATGPNPGANHITYLSMARNQKANPDNNRGSNATCITPEYYATWDNNRTDPRFHRYTLKNGGVPFRNDGTDGSLPYSGVFHFNRGFQEGQQWGPIIVSGKFVMDSIDNSRVLVQKLYTEKTPNLEMNFTRELNFDNPNDASFTQNQINRGVRVFKQEYDAENGRQKGSADLPIFRLGGIYTMRAEALFRKGDAAGALALINELRTKRWSIDIDGNKYYGTPITSLDNQVLYNEISYELYWEGERRQQMIRFGTFKNAYTAKPVSEPYRRVFPIPQSELDVNKDIKQNAGYN